MTWLPSSRAGNLVGWVLVWSALCGWQALAVAYRPRTLSLGDIVDLLYRWRGGRLLLLLGWFWLGWHVFVRGDW